MESKTTYKHDMRIDILKIISMLGIVFIHAVNFGGALDVLKENYPIQRIILLILFTFFYASTNLFVIVSAWFLPDKVVKPRKILIIAVKTCAYATAIYLVLVSLHIIDFSILTTLKNFLAIVTRQYWFITAYAVMYLLAPYINNLIKSLSKKELRSLVIILLSITTILPSTILCFPARDLIDLDPGQTFIWFITIYILIYYLKTYESERIEKISSKSLWLIVLGSVLILVLSKISLEYISSILGREGGSYRLYFNSSIFVIAISLSIFILFTRLPNTFAIKYHIIPTIASTTLGIYAISEQPQLRNVIWGYANELYNLHPSTTIILAFSCSFVVFIVSMLIDLLTNHTIFKKIH